MNSLRTPGVNSWVQSLEKTLSITLYVLSKSIKIKVVSSWKLKNSMNNKVKWNRYVHAYGVITKMPSICYIFFFWHFRFYFKVRQALWFIILFTACFSMAKPLPKLEIQRLSTSVSISPFSPLNSTCPRKLCSLGLPSGSIIVGKLLCFFVLHIWECICPPPFDSLGSVWHSPILSTYISNVFMTHKPHKD